jgi:hypothetical protein
MHDIDRTLLELDQESDNYEGDFELDTEFLDEAETDNEAPFNEEEEMELAAELLSVSGEAELDQFLGKLVKRAWRGARKLGSAAIQAARPLGGMLRTLAKQHLPGLARMAGTALGGPAGAALGGALGGAIGNALEAELEESEDRELELARRFVRVAGTAARGAAFARSGIDPRRFARRALMHAARRHLPGMASAGGDHAPAGSGRSGRWIRRGRKIILIGV